MLIHDKYSPKFNVSTSKTLSIENNKDNENGVHDNNKQVVIT